MVVWNSWNNNYMSLSYVSIFASAVDCRDMSTWMFSPAIPPTKTVPYGATPVFLVPFSNIPTECEAYIPPEPVVFTSLPAWISFSYPNMIIVPQTYFIGVTLEWTFSFY